MLQNDLRRAVGSDLPADSWWTDPPVATLATCLFSILGPVKGAETGPDARVQSERDPEI